MLRAGYNKRACKNIGKVVIRFEQRKGKSKTDRQFSVKFYSIKLHTDPFKSSLIYAYGRMDGRAKMALLTAAPHVYENT